MTKSERYRLEMLERVNDFGQAHPDLFPEGSIESGVFAEIGRILRVVDEEARAKLARTAEGRLTKKRARQAMRASMLVITRTARGMTRSDATVANSSFVMPKRATDVSLVQAARLFVKAGEALKEQFVRHRLPATTFTDLAAQVTAFEAASLDRRDGVAGQKNAQAALEAALDRGLEAARTLDALVLNVLANDVGLLAGWKHSRRVQGTKRAAPAKTPAESALAEAPAASAEAPVTAAKDTNLPKAS